MVGMGYAGPLGLRAEAVQSITEEPGVRGPDAAQTLSSQRRDAASRYQTGGYLSALTRTLELRPLFSYCWRRVAGRAVGSETL